MSTANYLQNLNHDYTQYINGGTYTTITPGWVQTGYSTVEQNKQEETMRVYEYVAYFVPTLKQKDGDIDALKANKIILFDKMIASNEADVRTKVIRTIPTDYEDVIDQVRIEVRAFR